MNGPKTLVVLPSYNESANIVDMIAAVLAVGPELSVCVVDDSSPDGTATVVRRAIDARPGWADRVELIVRAKKDGRGGAVRDGFAWGTRSGRSFECMAEMDCDFSHEPSAIPQGLALRRAGADVVIGARYPDGTIVGWPRSRRAFSFLANTLARALIDWSISDYTNGFRFYSPRAVDILLQRPQRHRGYIYLSESLSYLLRAGMRVEQFPIYFKNRERGVSNTSLAEVRSALAGIVSIAWEHRRARSSR
jgi:dolichol-phosphate mannosyltransferase